MTHQPTLFERTQTEVASENALPLSSSAAPPGTSHAAARELKPDTGRLRLAVFEYIKGCGDRGCIDEDGERETGIKHQTYTPRRLELVERGLVMDSGERRRNSGGRSCAVWIAKEQHEHL